MKTKYYRVDSYQGWMVVLAATKRDARKEGVAEFGRGMVKWVKPAESADVEYFERLKGKITKP